MPERAQVSVLILAGGASRRMGQDKPWLLLDGLPLVERAARRALPLAAEIIFSANDPAAFADLRARLPVPTVVVPDLLPGAGPLGGLQASLRAARQDLLLMLAADMPFANLALLEHLRGLCPGYDAVVPLVASERGEEPEPLHAFYRRTCLPAVESHLAAGDRRMVSFLGDVRTHYVPAAEVAAHDPDLISFFNVNTPADWERAQALVREGR